MQIDYAHNALDSTMMHRAVFLRARLIAYIDPTYFARGAPESPVVVAQCVCLRTTIKCSECVCVRADTENSLKIQRFK